jgi:pimeloyl-ACP methyl ester carboxylesterase
LGFGRSPWPKHIRYTLGDQLGAFPRTLVALGATQNVTFVGHSFGTVLGACYAARDPGEVRSLVLLGTPLFDSPEQGAARIRRNRTNGSR